MVEGKRALGRGNRQAGPGGKEGEWGGLLGRGEKGGWAAALGRAGEVGRRCWASAPRAGAKGAGPWVSGRRERETLGCWAAWAGLGPVGVLCFLFFLFFYFLFFCKLTQTSLNSNKLEFKLPSTQPK